MDNWDKIAELLEDLEALPAAERVAALKSRTGDPEIQREVLSLLAFGSELVNRLEKPALEWFPVGTASAIFPSVELRRIPRLNAGEILKGRYQIEGFLGRGGMAEVYSATDLELKDERVALKLLDQSLQNEASGFLGRFRQETLLARKISHPSVARVFGFESSAEPHLGTIYFCVMELIVGETLAARIHRDGAIAEWEAVAIAKQLAEGLHAAHGAKVLHRDLKSSNIMLADTGGRVAIVDFGLAAPILTPDGKAKTSSVLMGTPGYLAPEQWTGRAASTATDIYSFGIVLHEMIVGHHPVGGIAQDVPPRWKAVIKRCLEIDPAKRWTSAGDIVRALAREDHFWNRRHWIVGAATAAVAAGTGAVVQKSWFAAELDTKGAAARILIADIENGTGDPAFDAFPILLRDQASQSAKLLPASPQAISAIRRRMRNESGPNTLRLVREVAVRDGIPLVVFTSLSKASGEYVLQARLELMGFSPDQPSREWRSQWAAVQPGDLMRLASVAGDWIRDKAGEDAEQIRVRSKAPQMLTTRSWEALQTFHEAEAKREANQQHDDIALYKEALRIDPEFALAAYRIADLSVSRGDFEQGLQYWQMALRLSDQKGLSSYEIARIRTVFYDDLYDFENLRQSAQMMVARWPDDTFGHFFLANAVSRLGNFDAAVAAFSAAVALDPKYEGAHFHRAIRHLFLNNPAAAREGFTALERLGSRWRHLLLGKILYVEGDYSGSAEAFAQCSSQASSAGPLWRMQGEQYRAIVEADAGHPQTAIGIAEQGARDARSGARAEEGLFLYLKGGALCLVGDRTAVRQTVEAMEAAAPGYASAARAGTLLARAGFPAEAKARLDKLNALPDFPKILGLRHQLEGELALANRDFEVSAKELKRFDRLQTMELPRDYWVRHALEAGNTARARELAAGEAKKPMRFLFRPDGALPGAYRMAKELSI